MASLLHRIGCKSCAFVGEKQQDPNHIISASSSFQICSSILVTPFSAVRKWWQFLRGFLFIFSWEVVPRPLECWLTPANKRFLEIRRLIGRTEVNWALRIKKRRSIYKVCLSECEGPSLRTEAIAVPQQQYLPYWPSMDIRLTI